MFGKGGTMSYYSTRATRRRDRLEAVQVALGGLFGAIVVVSYLWIF
jgi:hypothetical protein